MTAKHVQQRTGEDEEIGESAEKVRLMLAPEEHYSHRCKREEDEEGTRRPEAPFRTRRVAVVSVIVGCHAILLTRQ